MGPLREYLAARTMESSTQSAESSGNKTVDTWFETDADLWKGAPPKIMMTYDQHNGWLLEFRLDVDAKLINLEVSAALRDYSSNDVQWWSAHHPRGRRRTVACSHRARGLSGVVWPQEEDGDLEDWTSNNFLEILRESGVLLTEKKKQKLGGGLGAEVRAQNTTAQNHAAITAGCWLIPPALRYLQDEDGED